MGRCIGGLEVVGLGLAELHKNTEKNFSSSRKIFQFFSEKYFSKKLFLNFPENFAVFSIYFDDLKLNLENLYENSLNFQENYSLSFLYRENNFDQFLIFLPSKYDQNFYSYFDHEKLDINENVIINFDYKMNEDDLDLLSLINDRIQLVDQNSTDHFHPIDGKNLNNNLDNYLNDDEDKNEFLNDFHSLYHNKFEKLNAEKDEKNYHENDEKEEKGEEREEGTGEDEKGNFEEENGKFCALRARSIDLILDDEKDHKNGYNDYIEKIGPPLMDVHFLLSSFVQLAKLFFFFF